MSMVTALLRPSIRIRPKTMWWERVKLEGGEALGGLAAYFLPHFGPGRCKQG